MTGIFWTFLWVVAAAGSLFSLEHFLDWADTGISTDWVRNLCRSALRLWLHAVFDDYGDCFHLRWHDDDDGALHCVLVALARLGSGGRVWGVDVCSFPSIVVLP